MPPGRHGRIARRDHLKWLSKGRLRVAELPEETLARTLRAIGHTVPSDGLAALRFWGQTGERSGAWMAAADPVHLQAGLNRLRLRAFRSDEIPRPDLRKLFDSLQELMGQDGRFAFARLGPLAYLRSNEPIVTSSVSPAVVDGREPDDFMPAGETAAAHDRLLGELQMALHDHQVNRVRASAGNRTINSIWFWGGGTAPEQALRPLPPVFSNDPLIRGYWLSCTGTGNAWTDDLDEVLELAPDGFVAVVPAESEAPGREAISDLMESLRLVLKRGDLSSLALLFRDGLSIEIARSDRYRFWRKISRLLTEQSDDD
jgi:hypothetical protein